MIPILANIKKAIYCLNKRNEEILDKYIKLKENILNKPNLWRGTQDEYDALDPDYDNNTIYIITPTVL